MFRNDSSRFIPQSQYFGPFAARGIRVRKQRWANGHVDVRGPWQNCTVLMKAPRASQRNRHDWPACLDRRPEGTQLKRAHSGLCNKCALRKYEYRFALKQSPFHLLRLARSCAQFAAFEGKMAQFAQKRADERHVIDLTLRQEMIVGPKQRHDYGHVAVARKIADVNAPTVSAHMLLHCDVD